MSNTRIRYLCLQTGKLFHTEEGGVGNDNPDLNGPGMPPNEDPPSWTPGLSMQQVNAVSHPDVVGVRAQLAIVAKLASVYVCVCVRA